MKFFSTLCVGLVLTTSIAKAEVISSSAAAASISFLYYSGSMSAAACAQEPQPNMCGIGVLAAHFGLTTSTLALLKENVQEVEADSMDFIAGEPMSLTLEEIIQHLRNESKELDTLSDLEIAGIILQSMGK